jgi:hypothetical protein
MANSARGGNGARNSPAPSPTTYGDFTATQLPLFTEAGKPLEADHWLWVMEPKFGVVRCTEVQKALFATQQLRGGPTTPPLTLWTIKCCGMSSAILSMPTTSPQAL